MRLAAAFLPFMVAFVCVSSAQAFSRDQCLRMGAGTTSAGWAPDNDVNALWNHYRNVRGWHVQAIYPDYFGAWINENDYRQGYWATFANGNKRYPTLRCVRYSNGVIDDYWMND